MRMPDMNHDLEINRASWDELAALHGQDSYYDSEALVAGASSLIEEEEVALRDALAGDVSGLEVLHLQCHLGFDAITFARRGASVTGVDFSDVALAKAARLASRANVRANWVRADAARLPDSLHERFGLVWATIGVLCWIEDLDAWMASAASALAPEGRLVLMDGHPLGGAFKLEPLRLARAYGGASRREIERGWDYATPQRTGPQVQFHHSLGEIVTAAAEAGLRVLQLREHTDLSHDLRMEKLQREDDGRFRRRVDGHAIPILFTLIASR
jgi:SAM-dependent methyltransferase